LKSCFVFSASNTFPYVKKRILVVQEEQYELTPVEVIARNSVIYEGTDPGFLERGGCLLFLNNVTGKIIAEKSNYRGGCNPHNPSPKSASAMKGLRCSYKTYLLFLFLQVAFDEMQNKVRELDQVISQTPPDMKKLQLVLQGSVSVQVISYLHYTTLNTFISHCFIQSRVR